MHFRHAHWMAKFAAWNCYAFLQGSVFFGIWILGHECGHRAFSANRWLCDAVGLFCHSALLTPYHSWRFTHAAHHGAASMVGKDTAFAPDSEAKATRLTVAGRNKLELLNEVPVLNLMFLSLMLLLGMWFYLGFNAGGQEAKSGRFNSHFFADSPDLFIEANRREVNVSVAAVLAVVATLVVCAVKFGLFEVTVFYLMPYLWNNAFFIIYTFLHHTHSDVPHFASSEWSFLRGALSTVDRDYGIFDHLHHRIGSTHVAHHLFKCIPHYHAEEATRHLRVALGEHYRRDDTPIVKALVREFANCKYIAEETKDSGVYWYKKK